MIEPYYSTLGTLVAVYIILALSQNIITGYAGQVSLGQAAFFGIGAYSSAILATKYNLSFWVVFPASIAITALVGIAIGAICLRLKEDFLVVATTGLNFIIVSIFLYTPFFGGAFGIGNIPPPSIFGHKFAMSDFFFMAIILVILSILISYLLETSWIGLALKAIREDEVAAETMGISKSKFKLIAFAISTAYAGLAGSYYAHFMTFIHPDDFAFTKSVQIFTFVAFGGLGTIRGAILGAVILGLAPEFFRVIEQYRMLAYGSLLIFMILFQPSGLIGDGSFVWEKLEVITRKLKKY